MATEQARDNVHCADIVSFNLNTSNFFILIGKQAQIYDLSKYTQGFIWTWTYYSSSLHDHLIIVKMPQSSLGTIFQQVKPFPQYIKRLPRNSIFTFTPIYKGRGAITIELGGGGYLKRWEPPPQGIALPASRWSRSEPAASSATCPALGSGVLAAAPLWPQTSRNSAAQPHPAPSPLHRIPVNWHKALFTLGVFPLHSSSPLFWAHCSN